jgi:hypothetical protein
MVCADYASTRQASGTDVTPREDFLDHGGFCQKVSPGFRNEWCSFVHAQALAMFTGRLPTSFCSVCVHNLVGEALQIIPAVPSKNSSQRGTCSFWPDKESTDASRALFEACRVLVQFAAL